MSRLIELADEIADIWARECDLDNKALLQTDPLLRSNIQAEAAELAKARLLLHDEIARQPAADSKEALILALFAADYFAQNAAGSALRDVPLRHLHNSVIAALEEVSGLSRQDLGLEFLWMSAHDGPGEENASN